MEETKGTPDIFNETISTSIIQLHPDLDLKYLGLKAEAGRLLEYAQSRTIASDEDQKSATEDLSTLAKLKKAIKERQAEYTKPLKEHLDTVNQAFVAVTGPLEQADKITRDKITAYWAAEEKKRREVEEINRMRQEAATREAALNQGEITEPVVVIPVPAAPATKVKTVVGNLGTRENWKVEVIDFKLLPDEYKIPDAAKLGKVVRAGLHTIAGCRIWNEPSLVVNTK